MSSIVCQGVQSCFEPLVLEHCSLKHKINQPKPNQRPQIPFILKFQNEHQENPCNQVQSENKNKNSSNNFDDVNNGDVGCWNIQSLSNKNKQVNQEENVYVHPLVKKSSLLSPKSLEMCTESLGSESGDEFSFPFSPKSDEEYRQIWRLKYEKFTKKVTGCTNFPPPLTSISGPENVQVTALREGGKLVLKAAAVSPCNSYFQAERVDGRLRLCLVDNSPTSKDVEIDGAYTQEEEEEYDDDEN